MGIRKLVAALLMIVMAVQLIPADCIRVFQEDGIYAAGLETGQDRERGKTAVAVPSEAGTEAPASPTTNTTAGTPANIPTDIPEATSTNTPMDIPADTPTNTPTDTPTATPTNTPTNIPTNTPTSISTATPTNIPTDIPVATPTNTPTSISTATRTNTPTDIPADTPTNTPEVTPTSTPLEGGRITLNLDRTAARAGEIITAVLEVSDIHNIGGYQVNLRYNPLVLQPVDSSSLSPFGSRTNPVPGSLMAGRNCEAFFVASNDTVQGTLNFGAYFVDRKAYKSGGTPESAGSLAVIAFRVLKPNVTDITLEECATMPGSIGGTYIYDWDGMRLTGYSVSGAETINAGGPAALPTPAPVETAGREPGRGAARTSLMEGGALYKIMGYVNPDLSSPDINIKAGFLVEVEGTQLSALTDASGFFRIDDVPESLEGYTVKISKTSYLYREIQDVAVNSYVLLGSAEEPVDIWAGDVLINGVQDNIISMNDMSKISQYFNTVKGDGLYDPNYDLNCDNMITVDDLMIAAVHFNTSPASYPAVTPVSVPAPATISSNMTVTEDVYYGDLTITGGTIDLNGHRMYVYGNLTQTGGTIDVHGGQLFVAGDYGQTGGELYADGGQINIGGSYSITSGILMMANSADRVNVAGNFLMDSGNNHEGYLTAGTLDIKGNFTQRSSSYNFAASGTHKVVLSGTGQQTISFDYPYHSYFNILEITNSSVSGVSFATAVGVYKELKSTSSVIVNAKNIYLASAAIISGGNWHYDLGAYCDWTMQQDQVIEGSIYINGGTISINNYSLTAMGDINQIGGMIDVHGGSMAVTGDYNQTGGELYADGGQINIGGSYSITSGILMMANSADRVNVAGNFLMDSGNNHEGYLTAGTLDIKGNFTQRSSSYNFAASGTHKVVLSGTGQQTVSFDSPGASHFNTLCITKPLEYGYNFTCPTPIWNSLVENYKYSTPIEGTTKEMPGLSAKRSGLAVASAYARLYAIGGYNGEAYLGRIDEYNPIVGAWNTKTSVIQPRSDIGAAMVDNQIYIIGGYNGSCLRTVEAYSPMGDQVTQLADMPTARQGLSLVTLGGRIYAIGGRGNDGSYLNTVEMYDTESDTWTTKESMPEARAWAGAALLDGKIYVIGGTDGTAYQDTVLVYDISGNTWMEAEHMQTARRDLGVCEVNGKIYALGGFNGAYLRTVEEFDPENGTAPWKTRQPLTDARSAYGLGVVYSQIYLIGGKNGSGIMASVQKYVPVTLPGLRINGAISRNTDSGKTLSGDYTVEVVDIRLDSPGIPVEARRSYNSSESMSYSRPEDGVKSVLGNGWRLNYDTYIKERTGYGRVTASALNIRKAPMGKVLMLVDRGSILTFKTMATTKDAQGMDWYEILMSDGSSGFAASRYVEIIAAGAEVKYGSGYSVTFDGSPAAGYKTPYGCYDKLAAEGGTLVLTMKDNTKYGYSGPVNGIYRLSWIKDRYQNQVAMTYDASGKLTGVSDGAGRSLSITYNGDRISRITDSAGRSAVYSYDADGNLTEVRNLNGNSTYYEYYTGEGDNRLKEIKGPDNKKTVTNYYDEIGRLYKQMDINNSVKYWLYKDVTMDEDSGEVEENGIERQYYDENNNKTTVTYSTYEKHPLVETYADGTKTEHTYRLFYDSAWHNATNPKEGDGVTESGYKGMFSENRKSIEDIKDRYGNTTTCEKDERGNTVKVTVPGGQYREYEYDTYNNLTMEADESGDSTFYQYSGNKLMIKAQRIRGAEEYTASQNQDDFAVTRYTYYADGENGYNIKGLLKTSTHPDQNTTNYTYYANGCTRTETSPSGNMTSYIYNEAFMKTAEISPMKFKTEYTYDNMGNIEKTVKNNGDGVNKPITGSSTTRTVYDAYGRKVQEISPNQYRSSDDNLANHAYNNANTGARYEYYDDGRLKTVKDAANNTTRYAYDNAGNIREKTIPNQSVYIYEYDSLNRLKKVSFKESTGAEPVVLEEYFYEISQEGLNIEKHRTYYNDSGYMFGGYSEQASRTDYVNHTKVETNTDGPEVTTQYNPNGTVAYVQDANGKTFYAYDGVGRVIAKRSPLYEENGTVYYTYESYTLSNGGRTREEKTGREYVAIGAYPQTYMVKTYEYNSDGKLSSESDSRGLLKEYDYDGDGNLEREKTYTSGSKSYTTEYLNNYVGKPDTMTQHVEEGDIYGNTFGSTADKELVTYYVYDMDGNITQMTTPDEVTVEYTYDALGRQTGTRCPGKDENGSNVTITTGTTYGPEGKPVTVTDPKGNITRYTYTKAGQVATMKKTAGGVDEITAYYYDRAGRKTAEVSPGSYSASKTLDEMNRTVYSYDGMDRLKNKKYIGETKSYEPAAGTWVTSLEEIVEAAYEYDLSGNIKKEQDALGYENGYWTEYWYNLANEVTEVLDPESGAKGLEYSEKYSYDTQGRKVSEIKTKGSGSETYYPETVYEYDDAGNLTAVREREGSGAPLNTIRTSTYDYTGNVLTETYGEQNTTTYQYNGLGKVRQVTRPGDATIQAYTSYYLYDETGRLKKQLDSMGKTDLYTYDSQGRQLSHTEQKTDGTGAITVTAAYDVDGNKRFETDGNGKTKEYIYDNLNRVKTERMTVANTGGTTAVHTTDYMYDHDGNLITQTEKIETGGLTSSGAIINTYDAKGRLIEKKDQNGKTAEKLEYNHNGAQIKSYDALNNLTQFEYDKNGRLTKTIDPEEHTVSQSYDNAGNIRTKTDGRENTTTYSYDEFDRLASVRNAKNETTSYTYDLNGNMLTQTDARGNITTYTYNAADKASSKTDDALHAEVYSYYADGSLMAETDRNGDVTSYGYDIHGRLLSQTTTKAGYTAVTISYTYDNNGNQLTMTDSTGTTTRIYDELNRVKTKTVPNIGTTAFTYDIITADGLTAEKAIDPKNNKTTKIYDRVGRLYKVIDGDVNGTPGATYGYFDNGNRQYVEYGDGAREEYTYYPDSQLHTLTNKKAGGTILETYTYEYDTANNQSRKNDGRGITDYTYDALNRMVTVTEPNGRTTSYTFDAAGNRSTETVVYGGTTTVNTYAYDDLNRLTGITARVNGSVAGTTSYIYDANGNQLTETVNGQSSAANTYDLLDRLVTTSASGNTVINTYNGEGLRVSKQVNGVITRYLYEYDQVVLETDGSNNQKARDIYGTNLLARTADGQAYYYMYNGHGDVTALVNAGTGNVDATYYYDAFGNILEQGLEKNQNYSQNFDSGSAGEWTTYGGTWSVAGGVYSAATAPGAKSVVSSVEAADLEYEADIKITGTSGDAGVIFRVSSPSTGADAYYGYYAGIDMARQGVVLGRAANNWTPITSVAMTIVRGQTYHIKVVAEGASIKVYVNDMSTPKISANDSTYQSGSIGLRTYGADVTFDSILLNYSASNLNNPYGYAGYVYDSETGLYYLNARMYDPVTARFLQEDSYTGDPNDPLSLNLYTYCHNEPIMYTDPTGHIEIYVNGMAVNFNPAKQEDQEYAAYVIRESNKTPNIKNVSYYTDRFYTEKAVIQAYDLLNEYKTYYNSYQFSTGYDAYSGKGLGIGFGGVSPEKMLNQMYSIQLALLENKAIAKKDAIFENIYSSFVNGQVMSPYYVDKLQEKLRSDPWYNQVISDEVLKRQVEGIRQFTTIAVGQIPGVGGVQSGIETVTGKDYITGEDVGTLGRLLAAAGIIIPQVKQIGKLGKIGDDVFVGMGETGLLFRKTVNTGAFSELSEPMQLRHVKRVAEEAGIGLDGVKIRIDRNPDLIGKGYTGWAHPKGNRIDIYPDAFVSREELIKTLAHERVHIYQTRTFGPAMSDFALQEYEAGARIAEKTWMDFLGKGGK